MAKKKETKSSAKTEKPRVNKELDGFDIQVNSFGEIITNYDLDKINEFLNRNVDDKKLRDREDLESLKRGGRSEEEEEKDVLGPAGDEEEIE
jgi:hypothetical protein